MDERRPTRESERRFATVVFGDISGFTAMSEKLDPEEVTAVMNRCFEILEAAVTTRGGHVDKYIGDCIMALFGVPIALEHAPTLALCAAIDMRNRLAAFNRQHSLSVPLDLHVGVNSGLVVAGQVGGPTTRDFTVMGDAVNLASRLKDLAHKGAIYVGAETYRYTRDEFEYRPLRPLVVKGKEQRVAVYELLSVREPIHRPKVGRADRRIASELVGRDDELRQLRQAVKHVLAGAGGIVSMVAEAGMGKSRLVAEMTALDECRDATVLEGRSVAIGQSWSFHPFVDLLRSWAGITDDDAEAHAAVKLEASVRALFASETGDVFPFIATLMGLRVAGAYAARLEGITGDALEKLTLKSMRDLVRRMAAAKPLILIFEDLHWADLSSLRLLEALFRLSESSPVLFINVFRPDHEGIGGRLLAQATRAQCHTAIQLERLTDKECDILIQNLVRGARIPYSTRALIWQKAEGNPFFIEEVILSLIDDGVIQRKDGDFRITGDISSVVIPTTIQDVIMARVDRLDDQARQLLQMSSVVGRSFYRRIIADLLPDHPNLDVELAVLKDKQLIFERTTHRTSDTRRRMFAGEVEYVFKHALIQQTVYESILHSARKEMHLKVAHSIETAFAERIGDFYGMLAYHFGRADSLEKAEEYLFKAGDEAARAGAPSEALTYFQEASRLYFMMHGAGGDPHKKALLEKNIGLALLNKGELMACIPHFDRALGHLGERVPRSRFGMALRSTLDLASVLYRLYVPFGRVASRPTRPLDHEVLEVRYNRARAQATSDPRRFFFDTIASIRRLNQTDASAIDEACGMYAGAAALFAFAGISLDVGRRFLGVASGFIRPENPRDLFVYRAMKFICHFLEGNWDEAYAVDEDLLEQGLRYGRLWDVSVYLSIRCAIKMHQGEFAAATKLIDRIAEIEDVFAYDFGRSLASSQTAILLLEERRLPEALEAIELFYKSRHEEVLNVLALGMKAKAQMLCGDRSGAAATLEKAEDVAARAGRVAAWHLRDYAVSRLLFDLAALEDRVTLGDARGMSFRTLRRKAARSARRAIRVARKVAKVGPEAFRLAGRLSWLVGQQERALRWWAKSIAEGERQRARPELARTYMEVAERLSEAGSRHLELNGMDPRAYLLAARELCADMGLEWDLARLGTLERPAA